MLTQLQNALIKIELLVDGGTNVIISNGYIEIIALDKEESGFISASIRQEDGYILEITREYDLAWFLLMKYVYTVYNIRAIKNIFF